MAQNVVVLTTGPLITLDDAKAHLRVDHSDEDELIQLYADASVQSCLTYCDLKLVPLGAEPTFKAAALLNLGDLYAFRSNAQPVAAVANAGLNVSAESLLRPFRIIRV